YESGRRSACARIQNRHVSVKLLQEILRFVLAVVVVLQSVCPSGQVVPTRSSRGLRVRSNNGDIGLDQIVPILDLLRIALAHKEHDGGFIRRAVVGQALLPSLGDEPLLLDSRHIVFESQGYYIRLQTVDYRAGLSSGA